jgi:hypothetical protein
LAFIPGQVLYGDADILSGQSARDLDSRAAAVYGLTRFEAVEPDVLVLLREFEIEEVMVERGLETDRVREGDEGGESEANAEVSMLADSSLISTSGDVGLSRRDHAM